MEIEDLFGDYVPPQSEKQIVPKPPTYEESLKDIMEGNKEIYVDPQYFPEIIQSYHPNIMKMKYLIMKLMMRIKLKKHWMILVFRIMKMWK